MRKFVLIVAIIGLGILFGFLITKPTETDINSLNSFIDGQQIVFEGIVDEVRELRSGSLIIIDEVKVFCECHNIFAGERVRVEGVIEEFDGNLRVKALILNVLK